MSDNNGWVVEPRPAPPELAENYQANPYRDPFMVTIQEKIGAAKREELMALFGGYPIDPSVTHE